MFIPEKEKLSLFSILKTMGLSFGFIQLIKQYLESNQYYFYDFEEFSKKHPEITTEVERKYKNKFLTNFNILDKTRKHKSEVNFIRYASGAKFLKNMLQILMYENVVNKNMLESIMNLFYNTVVKSEGKFIKKFQTSMDEYKDWIVKSPTSKTEDFYEIIYFEIKISSTLNKGFFYDSSTTTVEYQFKTKKFYSVNELIHWSCD